MPHVPPGYQPYLIKWTSTVDCTVLARSEEAAVEAAKQQREELQQFPGYAEYRTLEVFTVDPCELEVAPVEEVVVDDPSAPGSVQLVPLGDFYDDHPELAPPYEALWVAEPYRELATRYRYGFGVRTHTFKGALCIPGADGLLGVNTIVYSNGSSGFIVPDEACSAPETNQMAVEAIWTSYVEAVTSTAQSELDRAQYRRPVLRLSSANYTFCIDPRYHGLLSELHPEGRWYMTGPCLAIWATPEYRGQVEPQRYPLGFVMALRPPGGG